MTFEDLGRQLREEREKRGVSIDEVALHLKISGRIIRALEDGEDESLPHAVYVRGFIRSYAAYLGFNGEELATAMDTIADVDDSPAPPQSVYTPIDAAPLSRKKIFVALLLALCIVSAGGFWYLQDSDLLSSGLNSARTLSTATPAPPLAPSPGEQGAAKPAPRQGSQATQVTTPATAGPTSRQAGAQNSPTASTPAMPAPLASTPVVPAPAGRSLPSAGVNPANSASPAIPATQAEPQQAPQSLGQQTPQSLGQQGQQALSAHKIIITALAECWIHSNADSTDTRQFSLRKGDTFALTFNQKLVLKLGNAGGVRIRYDGEDLPAAGGNGQVRTLTFPLEQ